MLKILSSREDFFELYSSAEMGLRIRLPAWQLRFGEGVTGDGRAVWRGVVGGTSGGADPTLPGRGMGKQEAEQATPYQAHTATPFISTKPLRASLESEQPLESGRPKSQTDLCHFERHTAVDVQQRRRGLMIEGRLPESHHARLFLTPALLCWWLGRRSAFNGIQHSHRVAVDIQPRTLPFVRHRSCLTIAVPFLHSLTCAL